MGRPSMRLGVVALILAVVAAACVGPGADPPTVGGSPAQEDLFSRGSLRIQSDGGPVVLQVEIAETRLARATGLMNRESLAPDAGMVFLEPKPVRQTFWMKNTLIPLSVAFWDEEMKIQVILDMEPCRADPCPSYDPGVKWTGAVEVNQGFFEDHGIREGDRVALDRGR